LCLTCPDDKPIVIHDVKKVPFRWLAIECLTKGEFSYESDVWSFGVFMFELFSLGKMPYDDVSIASLGEFLAQGRRLAQPTYASDEMYVLPSAKIVLLQKFSNLVLLLSFFKNLVLSDNVINFTHTHHTQRKDTIIY
jgi:serine/threonine protein kinase